MFKNKVHTYLRRTDYTQMKNVGLSISQWLHCPLAIWAFALDGNLVRYCHDDSYDVYTRQFLLRAVCIQPFKYCMLIVTNTACLNVSVTGESLINDPRYNTFFNTTGIFKSHVLFA